MTGLQKIVKYCAIAFATLLIVSIFGGIISAFTLATGIFGNNVNITEEYNSFDIIDNFKVMDIDLKNTNLIIKKGEELKAETNNKNIKVNVSNKKLSIKDTGNSWISSKSGNLVIYIPEDFVLSEVDIESGAGKIIIDSLIVEVLNLDLGAGSFSAKYLEVLKKGEINGGAGEISILSGNLNNIDLDLGAGNVTVTSRIIGTNKIDSGVGTTNLNLIGEESDYELDIEKGIGSISINGTKISDKKYHSSGSNKIIIDGGVGSINVNISGN